MSRTKTFLILLGVSVLSYLFDCVGATLLKTYSGDLPFFERGPYTGICFLFTVVLLIAALVVPFSQGQGG